MTVSEAELAEIFMQSSGRAGRIVCPTAAVPAPGQYLLAQDGFGSGTHPPALLPVPVFAAGSAPGGFLAAAPLPKEWAPGTRLAVRGPLGRGFTLPAAARRLALLPFDGPAGRLLALISPALAQDAAVVLLSDEPAADLPEAVEAQPRRALADVLAWTDYLAVVVRRESLAGLRELLQGGPARLPAGEALVDAPMPCGGLAECGACAVSTGQQWTLACKEGPVFDVGELWG
jgi:hypothetical protein